MTEKVDVVLNYGGKWVLTPQVNYITKSTHIREEYDLDLLSYNRPLFRIHWTIVFYQGETTTMWGSSNKYYYVEGDSEIKTLQIALSTQSSVL